MKKPVHIATLIGTTILASWLLADVSDMALYAADPFSGREMGCYTDLEILFGLKTPAGWIRPLEAIVGITLFLALFAYVLWGAWRQRRPNGKTPHQLPERAFGMAPGRGSS